MWYIGAFVIWNVLGGVFLAIIWTNTYVYDDKNPLIFKDIYNTWQVNRFGCLLVFLLSNLLCPIASLCFWTGKFIHFICTVGRYD